MSYLSIATRFFENKEFTPNELDDLKAKYALALSRLLAIQEKIHDIDESIHVFFSCSSDEMNGVNQNDFFETFKEYSCDDENKLCFVSNPECVEYLGYYFKHKLLGKTFTFYFDEEKAKLIDSYSWKEVDISTISYENQLKIKLHFVEKLLDDLAEFEKNYKLHIVEFLYKAKR